MLGALTTQLRRSQELAGPDVALAVTELLDEALAPEIKADFLIALAIKGETVGELAAFVGALRAHSVVLPLTEAIRGRDILDVCGTGGDRLGTFNISTTVALVCAASGVLVAKHGNRAVTSRSGSADVLEQLGIPIELHPHEAADALGQLGFVFLFAPQFHPAFRAIAPARRLCAERGQRTLFNFIGPLLNPARPSTQLVGVSQRELVEPMARVLQSMGLRRAMVVCGEVGEGGQLDELSTLGENSIAEFYHDRGFQVSRWSPSDFPLLPASLKELAGGDASDNATLIEAIIRGKDRGPRRDAVLLNAGAALMVAGAARSITEGWSLAENTIDSGRAGAHLEALRKQR